MLNELLVWTREGAHSLKIDDMDLPLGLTLLVVRAHASVCRGSTIL